MTRPDQILEDVWTRLLRATVDKRHDFRRVVLATYDGNSVKQRIVLLRHVIKGKGVVVYTDARSQKVEDLKIQPEASLLFYSSKQRIQLSCKASVADYKDTIDISSWDHRRLKDYTTSLTPGSPISLEDDVTYDTSSVHFKALYFRINSIDYLNLREEGHLRILFEEDGLGWSYQRLVP